jgi:hypothetical protein
MDAEGFRALGWAEVLGSGRALGRPAPATCTVLPVAAAAAFALHRAHAGRVYGFSQERPSPCLSGDYGFSQGLGPEGVALIRFLAPVLLVLLWKAYSASTVRLLTKPHTH